LPVAIEIGLSKHDAAGDGMLENASFERSALRGEQTRHAHVDGYEFHSDYQTTQKDRAMQISL